MSIILDALKKSETDRQRQTGPALFEVKVAPPKAPFPVWAVAIVALLVVNMMIVGWLLLRHSARSDETTASNAAPAVATTPAPAQSTVPPAMSGNAGAPSVSVPPPQSNTASNTMPNATFPSTNGTNTTAAPPQSALAPSGAPPSTAAPPSSALAEQPGQRSMRLPERDQTEPTLAGNAAESGAETSARPDDLAPATEPNSSLFKGHVQRGTESGLMLYQDLAVAPGANLPELRLDLHVYAQNPQERFALINMRKLHEGDSLQGGVRVESITPDGVVMSHGGTKFLLPRD